MSGELTEQREGREAELGSPERLGLGGPSRLGWGQHQPWRWSGVRANPGQLPGAQGRSRESRGKPVQGGVQVGWAAVRDRRQQGRAWGVAAMGGQLERARAARAGRRRDPEPSAPRAPEGEPGRAEVNLRGRVGAGL